MRTNIKDRRRANKRKVGKVAQPIFAPSREEQIATLRDVLNNPSTPDSVKPFIESAIVKIEYRPIPPEVIR